MNPAHRSLFTGLPGRLLFSRAFPTAGLLLAAGCTPHHQANLAPGLLSPRPAEIATLSPPAVVPRANDDPKAETAPAPARATREIQLSLDTIFRMAEGQNDQIALAREKLNESQIEQNLADLSWLPNIHVGTAYYRHEGGIQNENGTLTRSSTQAIYPAMDVAARLDLRETMFQRVNAERKIWQQQGELARITSEKLLEAANTYIDLLAARTSEAVFRRAKTMEEDLLKWAEALFKQEPSAEILVVTIKAQLAGRDQAIRQARAQGDAAAVQLAYLLGLPPDVQLIPAESALKPVELTDRGAPVEALIARALDSGPGVRELEMLLALIQDSIESAGGCGRFLPALELRMTEGGFGAGPRDTLTWENRWDMGVQMRWNISDLLTAKDRSRLAQSKLQQTELGYRDLRGKLTAGVQEARQSIDSSRQIITLGTDQIKNADRSYELSNLRLKQRTEGSSTTEVLAAIRGLEAAHLASVGAIRAHNKAQIRLMILTGGPAPEPHHK